MGVSFLALADQEDGSVKLEMQYEGGFNPKSHAHQQLKLALAIMDRVNEWGKPKAGGETQPVDAIDMAISQTETQVAMDKLDLMHQLAKAASENKLPTVIVADANGRVVG